MPETWDRDRLNEHCLAHIGITILSCQALERTILLCVEHWFPLNAGLELDEVQQEHEKLSKSTLGRLVVKFKEYKELPERFDAMLNDTLEERNRLVHKSVDDFALSDEEGVWRLILDCMSISNRARFSRRIFERFLLDAQIEAFENTSALDSPLKSLSDDVLRDLREKRGDHEAMVT